MMEEIFGKPFLLILIGNVGTGKSTISNIIHRKFGGVIICGDKFKEDNSELTEPDFSIKFFLSIEKELMNHNSVILDGQNLLRKGRARYINYAKRYNSKIVAIDCGIGDEISLSNRLKENRGISEEIWRKEFENSRRDYEMPTKEEGFEFIFSKQDIILNESLKK